MDKICLATLHTPNMDELAEMTLPSKASYCQRQGYELRNKRQTSRLEKKVWTKKPEGHESWPYDGFDKVNYITELLSERSDDVRRTKYDWIFWCDCDTLITNQSISVEQFMEDDKDFIITVDHAGLNGGVFLLRNSVQGWVFWRELKEKMYQTAHLNDFLFGEEQTAMQMLVEDERFQARVKILPQKAFNSYPYKEVYGHPNGYPDKTGANGTWEPGDFVIHIPGFGPDLYERRLQHFKQFLPLIK